MKVIAGKYGFNYPFHEEIKKADEIMLQVEWDCLMLNKETWKLETHQENETKRNFVSMFRYYTMLSVEQNPERSVATESASSNADSNTKQIEP
jgi:hypothetical protein